MKPKASSNKFAEFVASKSDARRKQIVRDQLTGNRGFPPWYSAFPKPARAFVTSEGKDAIPIMECLERMKIRREDPKLETDSDITTEALTRLLEMDEMIAELGHKYAKAPRKTVPISVGLVDVMVTADLFVLGKRNNAPLVGALKFYTVKTNAHHLNTLGATVLNELLYRWLLTRGLTEGVPELSLCYVLQSFPKRLDRGTAWPNIDIVMNRAADEYARLWRLLSADEAA